MIKEVADVVFYNIETGAPELYLDTLKVSTIEQTAEISEARGGKGNTALLSWDFGKEINVTLEDALFSAKSMAIMFGNGTTTAITGVTRTFEVLMANDSTAPTTTYEKIDERGEKITLTSCKWYDEKGANVSSLTSGARYFVTGNCAVTGHVIEISTNSFPGTLAA